MNLKMLNPIATSLALARGLSAIPSSFDVNSFAAGSHEGEGDTRRFLLPAKEYMALIVGPFGEDKKTRIKVPDKGGFVIFEVVWQPSDPQVMADHKLEKLPTVRQNIFLDFTDAGTLDMGPFKNGDLNKLRTVFGLNKPGVKWSFADFIGKPAKIKVEHRPNKDDPSNPFVNVTAVTAA